MRNPLLFKRHIKNNPFQKKEICFYPNGTKYWWLNDQYHREDGPSIRFSNGEEYWYLYGHKYYLKEEYLKAAKRIQKKHKLP